MSERQLDLNGPWQKMFTIFRRLQLRPKVPSTVYGTLLAKRSDPGFRFYRDNELDALKLMENEFRIRDRNRDRRGRQKSGPPDFYISTELIRSRMFI